MPRPPRPGGRNREPSKPADVEKCRKFDSVRVDQDSEPFAAWVCSGVAGYVVTVTDDDLRTTVSVGTSIRRAKDEPAAGQSFGPFNSAAERIDWPLLPPKLRDFLCGMH